jgi:hypothetical protein
MAFESYEVVGMAQGRNELLVIPLRDLDAAGDPFYAVVFYMYSTEAHSLVPGESTVKEVFGPFATAEEAVTAAIGYAA